MTTSKKSPTPSESPSVTRITVSVPAPDYQHLVRVAEAKRVSVSWVVRDAVEKYLSADVPLFSRIDKTNV
jgi:hypothetical protein